MANRTINYDVENNTYRTDDGPVYYNTDSTVHTTINVNYHSLADGDDIATGFKFDVMWVANKFWYSSAYISGVNINGGAGDDWFNLNHLGDSGGSKTTWWLHANMGDGNDTVIMDDDTEEHGVDTIYLGNGDDYAYVGWGNDTVYGEAGNDRILGRAGNDYLDGGSGNDYLDGGDGDDILIGGDGNDVLIAGTGNDKLDGGNGNDQLWATLSQGKLPTLTGGAGHDVFTVASDLRVNSSVPQVDWLSKFAGALTSASSATASRFVLEAAALGNPWNALASTGLMVGNSLLGAWVQGLAAGASVVHTSTVSGTYVTLTDFDPRYDTLQVTFDRDAKLGVDYSATTGATLYVYDTANSYRVKAALSPEFTNLFGGNVDNISSMMNTYLSAGLHVTNSAVYANGTDVSNTLGTYNNINGKPMTVSDFGVTEGHMFVLGSFAGQTLDGGYLGTTPILTGTAGADLISAQRIDFSHSDAANPVESMAQVNVMTGHFLHGGEGGDVLIGGAVSDRLYGDEGDDQLFGLGGDDVYTGGDGNDIYHVLTPCLGNNQINAIVNAANAGSDTITDFGTAPGINHDTLYIDDTTVKAEDITITTHGNDTVIGFVGRSNIVTLQNVNASGPIEFSVTTSPDQHVEITGSSVGSPCFITTATVEQFGWADNCAVLTMLRRFRDEHMATRPEWQDDIATYYKVAPHVVAATRGDRALYAELWRKSLRPAVAAVVAGKHQRAYDIYRKMFVDLARRYAPTQWRN